MVVCVGASRARCRTKTGAWCVGCRARCLWDADGSTCDLVVFCARVLGGEQMVLVDTYRSEEVPPSSPLGWLLGELAAGSP